MIQLLNDTRVLFSRDGTQALQVVAVHHDTSTPAVHLSIRATLGAATREVVIRPENGLGVRDWMGYLRMAGADTELGAIALWLYWNECDEAYREGAPFVLHAESHLLQAQTLLHWHRKRKPVMRALDVVEHAVVMSTKFGVPAVIDELVSSYAGCTFEELRAVVMEGKGYSWEVVDDRKNKRLELEALGAFRASRGLLQSLSLLDALSAPRYAGVLSYWRSALDSLAGGADAAGSIANAAHAAEALIRIVSDSNDTFGAALKRLREAGRITDELFKIAGMVHGRTSGDIGARHGVPSGPTGDTRDAELYIGSFAAIIGQLLIADRRETP